MKKEKTKEQWLKLLKESKAYCYIKPTRYVHESGFRCFEVGYLTISNDNRVKDKLVLSTGSDHIQLYEYFDNGIKPNLDLLLDGYIRIFPFDSNNYWWGSMDYVLSSAQLEVLSVDRSII